MKCINGRLVTGTHYITCGECEELSSYTNQTHTHQTGLSIQFQGEHDFTQIKISSARTPYLVRAKQNCN